MAYINKDKLSWYYVVSNGKDPITNKPRQIKKRGFKTEREAKLAALEVELQIKKGEYSQGENMRFQALYDEWIAVYSLSKKESTIRNRIQSAKHLLSVWKGIPINKITKPNYRRHMNSLVPNYMYNTRDGIHITGKMIFDYAVDMEYLQRNPTESYKVPQVKKYTEDKKKIVFLEKEELAEFLKIAKYDGLNHDYLMFSLLAFSGMRIGEVLTLKWKDIDFEANTISIKRTLYNPNNNKRKFQLQSTKSTSSERELLIDQVVMNIIKSHKKEQEHFIKRNERIYKNHGFVVACSEGYPRTIKIFADRLRRILKRMDINKHITPHSFRHTHASLLIEADTNTIVISHRLGHASTKEVEKTYGHMTKGIEKEASQKFSELMKGFDI